MAPDIYLTAGLGKQRICDTLEITLSENIFELLQDIYVGVFHRDYYRVKN